MRSNLLSQSYSDYLFVDSNSLDLLQDARSKKKNIQNTLKRPDIISYLKKKYPNDYIKQKNTIKNIAHTNLDNVNIPVLLEFYRVEGDFEELKKLITRLEASEDSSHKSWAAMYKLLVKFSSKVISPQELINASMEIPTSTKEMKLFSLTLHLFGIYRLDLYESFYKLSKYVLPLVDEIENDYLRNSYRFQLLQIHAASNLHVNKIENSRKLCVEAINMDLYEFYPYMYSNFYHVLATSYLFVDFTKTMYWLNKACQSLLSLTTIQVKARIQNIQNTMYFAENYWRQNINYLPLDPSETAHRLIVTNRNQEAVIILDQLYKQQGYFSPFQEYYYAIATRDTKRLQLSKEKFTWKSNFFYLELYSEKNLNLYNLS